MTTKIHKLVCVSLFVILMISGCASIFPETSAPVVEDVSSAPTSSGTVCLVTDTQGINDRSFNATAWKGVVDAESALSIGKAFLESPESTYYQVNIESFLQGGCDLIVTVGYLIGEDTAIAATKNQEQKFAIVDYDFYDYSVDPPSDVTYPNVKELTFQTDEAAFLAGYVAASVTKTGIVGTFGGVNIPTVTIFMDGFALGVEYYNQQHGTDIRLIGWDPYLRVGQFTGTFDEVFKGFDKAEALADEGADIIIPVAGGVGLGAAALARERGDILIIGVDSDWAVSAPEYSDLILTSVLKNIDVAVFNTINSVQDGTFQGGLFIGTLENDGVGIAPFRSMEDRVPEEIKSDLVQIKADIISGAISTQP
ncbi:MAG: BMP family ABC transporter substrate-binding protein [Anaerolineales bacterium]|nr:BMP family ABC transporter substrate-binding protein [Anaerolineales bacterium]